MKALGAVARPVAKPWYRGDAKGEPPMSASRKRSLKEPRCVPPMLSWLALRPRWLHATCAQAQSAHVVVSNAVPFQGSGRRDEGSHRERQMAACVTSSKTMSHWSLS